MGERVSSLDVRRRVEGEIPIVALPPNFILPARRKGRETVVTPGTSSRITMTSSGFEGPEFDMIPILLLFVSSFLSILRVYVYASANRTSSDVVVHSNKQQQRKL